MSYQRGVLRAGEKVQLTDRKGNMLTFQLRDGNVTDTAHGIIRHVDIIGRAEGTVIETHNGKAAEQDTPAPQGKPWKSSRRIGGWEYCVMRPRLADYVLSMPRGAQIMYPKDIATVLELGDIRPGMRVLESGAGSGAMSVHILEAIGETGELTTIERRPDFAHISMANATVFYGEKPHRWTIIEEDFNQGVQQLDNHYFDRMVLDLLDPWNRLEEAYRVLAPGGVLACYVTTTTQMSRVVEALVSSGQWTQPHIQESMERSWKVDGLAVRPEHSMIGHTGFLIFTRSMAEGFAALKKRERPNKDTVTDIDDVNLDLSQLELRDMSDRKLRKVIRDLNDQVAHLESLDSSDSSDSLKPLDSPDSQSPKSDLRPLD
ncbi:tRNA (adenine-N1)-methyltransferase [Alloscardovia criceti]|uniref:tRNA (adenine-N1)-methyltransferase n=1 Tax=Alloscardovia criceti TaxID=356828 RepID=UPI000369B788|nr:tRNA (adenine-N1)-methyltransferase [Alloscardovia criceti]